ncbi:unnamed protein product [Moneuplotes crassus]|uniref:Uncharacterized protein n=1 Tax=Euplotes crassus TaxID=5936 RepID=A0AAD1XKG2_EUPCR|nr:unnamed protein product [Moneuplotes crassus]
MYQHYSNLISKSITLYGEDSDLVKETIKEVVSRLDLKEANVEEKIIEKYEINTATLTFLLDTVELEEIEELKTWMKESKIKVLQGEFQVYLDKSLVEVNTDNTKVTNKIPKELYYELLSKILCDLRHEVKLRKEKFYAEGNTVMTTKDRDQILNSIDGVQVRENVFKEFGIKSNLPAVEVLKNCFDAYSIDLNFKMKVTTLSQEHERKVTQILSTRNQEPMLA